MEIVRARLNVEVYVDCPECDALIDLLDKSDTNNHDLDEEGQILKQAFPDGHWHEEHKKFYVDSVTCSQCKSEFKVKELEW